MTRSTRLNMILLPALVIAIAGWLVPREANGQEGADVLKKFVGQWSMTSKGSMGEGQPEMEATSTMNARMLGDHWVVCEMDGNVAGMNYQAIQSIGYDSSKDKFVGSWMDTTMPHLWVYEGSLDESGTKLTLEAEGPDMMDPGKMRTYRDAYEFVSDDKINATSSMLGDDGEWVTFMKGTAERKK